MLLCPLYEFSGACGDPREHRDFDDAKLVNMITCRFDYLVKTDAHLQAATAKEIPKSCRVILL
jgi:hypothetical protein